MIAPQSDQRGRVSTSHSPQACSGDVAYVAGCALASFGCIPLIEALVWLYRPHDGTASESTVSLTIYDSATLFASALLSLLGAIGVALQWLQLRPATLHKYMVRLAVAMVVATAMAATVVRLTPQFKKPVLRLPWVIDAAHLPADTFQWKINHGYCHALAAQVCSHSDVAQAKQAFPLSYWPETTQSVAAYCLHYEEPVRRWNQPPEREICSICRRLDSHGDEQDALLLTAFGPPLATDRQWCGEYIANHRTDLEDCPSPYDTHQEVVQKLLHPQPALNVLRFAPTVLKVVVLWAMMATSALVYWVYRHATSTATVFVAKS